MLNAQTTSAIAASEDASTLSSRPRLAKAKCGALSPRHLARGRELQQQHGLTDLAKILGASRTTLGCALAGATLRAGTRLLVEQAIDTYDAPIPMAEGAR